MEKFREKLCEARDSISEAIDILEEEQPSDICLHEELREQRIIIWEKIHNLDISSE